MDDSLRWSEKKLSIEGHIFNRNTHFSHRYLIKKLQMLGLFSCLTLSLYFKYIHPFASCLFKKILFTKIFHKTLNTTLL